MKTLRSALEDFLVNVCEITGKHGNITEIKVSPSFYYTLVGEVRPDKFLIGENSATLHFMTDTILLKKDTTTIIKAKKDKILELQKEIKELEDGI